VRPRHVRLGPCMARTSLRGSPDARSTRYLGARCPSGPGARRCSSLPLASMTCAVAGNFPVSSPCPVRGGLKLANVSNLASHLHSGATSTTRYHRPARGQPRGARRGRRSRRARRRPPRGSGGTRSERADRDWRPARRRIKQLRAFAIARVTRAALVDRPRAIRPVDPGRGQSFDPLRRDVLVHRGFSHSPRRKVLSDRERRYVGVLGDESPLARAFGTIGGTIHRAPRPAPVEGVSKPTAR